MKKIFFLLLVSTLFLLNSFAGAADAPASARPVNPFFAFDNGVGRDQKWSPVQQAAVVKELGFDGIGYTGIDNLAERQKVFREQGLKIFSLYVPCYVDKAEAFDPRLKEAMQQLKGTETMLWLTVQGKATNDESAVRIVRELADAAQACGVRIALYPHKGFFVATAADAMRLIRQVNRPNVGVSINLCHELAAGNADQMENIIKTCLPRLYLVAINGADRTGGWNELIRPLGEGNYDVVGFLKLLKQAGYTGPIGLQCYNVKGGQKENLERSMAAWRKMAVAVRAD